MNDLSFDLDLIATVLTSLYLGRLLFTAMVSSGVSCLDAIFSLDNAKRSLLNQQVRRRTA